MAAIITLYFACAKFTFICLMLAAIKNKIKIDDCRKYKNNKQRGQLPLTTIYWGIC
jgi:hypothetical protein